MWFLDPILLYTDHALLFFIGPVLLLFVSVAQLIIYFWDEMLFKSLSFLEFILLIYCLIFTTICVQSNWSLCISSIPKSLIKPYCYFAYQTKLVLTIYYALLTFHCICLYIDKFPNRLYGKNILIAKCLLFIQLLRNS